MNYKTVLFKTTVRSLLVMQFLLLGACSWLDAFRDDDVVRPNELTKITEEVKMKRVWSVNVGKGQGKKFNRLSPVYANGKIYAASTNGIIVAVDAESGKTVWRQKTDYPITGATGAGNGLVLIGTANSLVVAFDETNGNELWQAHVTSEVLAAPVTNGRMVVVQTLDGSLIALDAQTGTQRWIYENSVPALTLRGTSAPRIIDNFVVSAMANGAVISVALDNGTLRWEERVAIPTGRSDIDRLVDIDGDLTINDAGLIIAPSYQGYVAAIDAVTGQTRWRSKESSYVGAGSGFGNIYIVDDLDNIKAYRTGQDTTIWVNELLLRRQLTTPLSFSNYVALGDFEGYVHLLSQVDGRIVGRFKVDGDGIRARMLYQGSTLYTYGNSGTLAAYTIR